MPRRRPRTLLAGLCCVCLPWLVQPSPGAAAAPALDGVEAIWRVQEFTFSYSSSNVYYTCGALRQKIAAILTAVGAAEQPFVEIRHCPRNELRRSAHVQIRLRAPVRATPENVREATTFDSTAQLVARVRNERLPTENDLERFPANWQSVSLFHHRQLALDPGDCELLRGLREQIFPKLAIRITRDGPHCAAPGTRLRPTLEVAALMPLPERSGQDTARP